MNGLIIGRRRQGKSTLALTLCRSLHETVFVFDPNSQFRNIDPTFDDIDDLQNWLASDTPHKTVCYRPDAAYIADEFTDLCDTIKPLGNYALLCDEAGALQRPNSIHPSLEWYMRQAPRDGSVNLDGRNIDVTIIQTVHRPADSNSLCRALCTDTFFFQAQLQRDLDVIKAQHGEAIAESLPHLQRWHCVHAYTDLEGRQRYARWTNPADWYTPIS